MSEALGRFLSHNLGASVVAGLWGVAVVYGVTWAARVRSAALRNELLVLPLVKSTLVLLGLVTVMPFPAGTWRGVRAEALPFSTVGPVFVVWTGVGLLGLELLRRRGVGRALRGSRDAPRESRAARALARLRLLFRSRRGAMSCAACAPRDAEDTPRLSLSDRASSPMLVGDRPPRMVLPRALVSQLDDEELEGVLAHEMAHLWLRYPCGGLCESDRMSRLAVSIPVSLVLGRLLARQEELACDEIAAEVTGRPEALAAALVKTYEFQLRRGGLSPVAVAQLLGRRPWLRRRVERLLEQSLIEADAVSRMGRLVVTVVATLLIFVPWG